MKLRILPLLLAGLGWLPLALPGRAQDANPNGGKPQSLPTVTLHVGKATLTAEVASTEPQRETGLMYRPKMNDNHGMIFLLPLVDYADFWMKNTLIPLSVAYIDKNGVILEIHDMQPADPAVPDDKLPITRSDSNQVAYALETNVHWFALNGIKPGDRIEPPPSTLGKPSP